MNAPWLRRLIIFPIKKYQNQNVIDFFVTPKNCEACEISTTQIPYKIDGMDFSPDKSAFCFTVNIPVVSDVAQT